MGLVKVYGILLCGIICAVDRYADMRHKWKKIKATLENKEFFEEIQDGNPNGTFADFFRSHYADGIKECVQCGLRKGSCKSMGFFPRLVFYRYSMPEDLNKLLSVDRIPYTCTPLLKDLNRDFISMEEFQA